MKTLFAILLISTTALYAQSQLPEYYLATPSKYLGQKITIYVNSVHPSSNASDTPGMVWFRAHTSFGDKFGKSISVRVPEADAKHFLQRYGMESQYYSDRPRSLPLNGIFSENHGTYFIDYGGSSTAAD
ncbi:MAG: hypothetical protein ABI443_14555, partial [Chthoniobacterales bacterium]